MEQLCTVMMEGVPVYRGNRLTTAHPVLQQLRTTAECIAFARELRGPFALVVERGESTIAITDFGACFPIFLAQEPGSGRLVATTRANDQKSHRGSRLSQEAMFWWATRGGVGNVPMSADMKLVPSATVLQITNGVETASTPYIDWMQRLSGGPDTFEDARDEFTRISGEYLSALAPDGSIACFLSGGIDSAVTALLAQRAGLRVVCFTAEYRPKRYSELDGATRFARALELEHHAVPVGYGEFRQNIYRLNHRRQDVPAGHSQLISLVSLGDVAHAHGLDLCLTGDNAGPVFLEFDHFFHGLPTDTPGFARAAAAMSVAEFDARQGSFGRLDAFGEEILLATGVSAQTCRDWLEQQQLNQRREAPRYLALGYPLAAQVPGQQWAGVAHQNCWLPAQRAVNDRCQILSPFLDIEMIRFALALPLHLKYRDGVSKWFLREFLDAEKGLTAPKRASPNPSRYWWLPPRPDDLPRVDPRIRSALLRLQGRNVLAGGSRHGHLAYLTSLGLWLRDRELNSGS